MLEIKELGDKNINGNGTTLLLWNTTEKQKILMITGIDLKRMEEELVELSTTCRKFKLISQNGDEVTSNNKT